MQSYTDDYIKIKQLVKERGLKNLSEERKIQFALTYVTKNVDIKKLSKKLFANYKNFSNVLEASAAELSKFPELTPTASFKLHMLGKLCYYYKEDRLRYKTEFDFLNEIRLFLVEYYELKPWEELLMFFFNHNGKYIKHFSISQKIQDGVQIDYKRILQETNGTKAKFVILAHNHPSSTACPSATDISSTSVIIQELKKINLILVDHYIVGGKECYSMSAKKLISEIDTSPIIPYD